MYNINLKQNEQGVMALVVGTILNQWGSLTGLDCKLSYIIRIASSICPYILNSMYTFYFISSLSLFFLSSFSINLHTQLVNYLCKCLPH